MSKKKAELGDLAKDVVTGFEGIVMCVSNWLNGCRRVTIQPQKLHEGKPLEGCTFDSEQLVVTKPRAIVIEKEEETGGPTPEPARQRNPAR